MGRFIVDTHVHAQRFAAGKAFKEKNLETTKASYNDLASAIRGLEAYDNSPRLMYDMDCYDVDMCVLLPAFGMSNEMNAELVERHPDKFVATCSAMKTAKKARMGEEPWTPEAAAKEIDELLTTGNFVGIGEGMPADSSRKTTISQTERMDQIRPIMDIARKHKTVVQVHSGVVMGYPLSYHYWPETLHPMWVSDLAVEYPDVPIVINHGGVQG
ncbi:MAG: amidohydrolase family protein, partial [Rhodospirillales bacterium]|nr:amidohydrolase family protein [Rhodospirillales bacterium]